MKMPTPPPDNDDEDDTDEVPFVPPNDDDPHQPFHRAQREALVKSITACRVSPKPDALAAILIHFEAAIHNQKHVGTWDSLWPLLDAVRHIPDCISKGLVVFGGWPSKFPQESSELAPPPVDLVESLADYELYSRTLGHIHSAYEMPDSKERLDYVCAIFKFIVANRPKFGAFASIDGTSLRDIEKFCVDYLAIFGLAIECRFHSLTNTTFAFFPDSNPGDGWRKFFAFADAYKCLRDHKHVPDKNSKGFVKLLFLIQMPEGN